MYIRVISTAFNPDSAVGNYGDAIYIGEMPIWVNIKTNKQKHSQQFCLRHIAVMNNNKEHACSSKKWFRGERRQTNLTKQQYQQVKQQNSHIKF